MTPPALVVDLGSSGVSAALVVDGTTRQLTEPGGTAHRWPASACLDSDGVLLGTAAERRKRAVPTAYVPDVRGHDLTGSTAPRLVTAVLAALRNELDRIRSEVPERLVLTVPAGWPAGHRSRDVLLAAGGAAGFPDVELLPAAVAAAFDDDVPVKNGEVIVGDVGARGAMTLVRRTSTSAEVLAHRTAPGGVELDRVLREAVWQDIAPYAEPMVNAPGDAGQRGRFEIDAFVTRLRHQLSDGAEAEDTVSPLAPPYRLGRSVLRELAREPLNALLHALAAVTTRTGREPSVMLVGGVARMPEVREAVANALGADHVAVAPRPELAVARGAARWAGSVVRSVRATAPTPRVKPLTWTVPDGHASLLRWAVPEGDHFGDGAVVAVARTRADTLVDLVAPRGGVLLAQRLATGDEVTEAVAAAVRLDPAPGDAAGDAPQLVADVTATEVWLEADSLLLLDVDDGRLRVRRRAVDGSEERRLSGVGLDREVSDAGLFRGPAGTPVVVALTGKKRATLHVLDLAEERTVLTFRDGADPFTFSVNEITWQMITENSGGLPIGMMKYRNVIWSLAKNGQWRRGGRRVWETSHTSWSKKPGSADFRRPGDSGHSGFSTARATGPDGRSIATVDAGRLTLTDAASGRRYFDTPLPEETPRVAFTADGAFVLVRCGRYPKQQVRTWRL